MIQFTVMGDPVPKARARTTVQGGFAHSYTPAKTVQYERKVAAAYARAANGFKFAPESPLKMSVYIYMPIPKSAGKRLTERLAGGVWHTKKPDASNVLKSVEDSLNGIAYKDDSQIAAEWVQKKYSDCPRVEVKIEELSE